MAILNLLASQAAISIQNANMYSSMQKAKEQAQHAMQAQKYVNHETLEFLKANYRFRQLSEFLPLIVYSLRLDGDIEYINQRWCTYTGLSLEESLGSQWFKCVHDDDIINIMDAVTSSSKGGKDLDIECRLKV